MSKSDKYLFQQRKERKDKKKKNKKNKKVVSSSEDDLPSAVVNQDYDLPEVSEKSLTAFVYF